MLLFIHLHPLPKVYKLVWNHVATIHCHPWWRCHGLILCYIIVLTLIMLILSLWKLILQQVPSYFIMEFFLQSHIYPCKHDNTIWCFHVRTWTKSAWITKLTMLHMNNDLLGWWIHSIFVNHSLKITKVIVAIF